MDLPVNYDKLHYTKRRVVREEYIRLQEGRCCHCKELLDGEPSVDVSIMPVDRSLFPIGFFKNPVHLHHCHSTGMTIGAIHNYCNAVLWQHHDE